MSEHIYDCLIVGGGVAGCTAGMYAKRYSLDVCVADRGDGGNTAMASLVENYPGFPGGIEGYKLIGFVRKQAEETGVPFVFGDITHLERQGELWHASGEGCSILARTVIIAMGAYPRSLMVPGEKELRGKGLSYCATCDGPLFKQKVVAVVGGGNSAVDEACYLAALASKVYLIHRRNELRADQYLRDRAFATPNLEILWDTVVTRVLGETEVTGVELKNVKTEAVSELPLNGLFAAIGHIAKTEWLRGLLDMEEDFIKTDTLMATNQPGVFACGDVRVTPLRQITTAVGDATLAAYSAYQWLLRHGR